MRKLSPSVFWSTVILASTLFPDLASAQDGARRGGRRAGRGAITALEVGTIHTVDGPTIRNGVILIGRGRILGVGAKGKVRIPQGAKVESYPDAHAYPGLVDALSTAFTSSRELSNRSVNAGTDFRDALDPSDEPSRKLIRYGITTAYVANRSSATWRGKGAIIRPTKSGFAQLRTKRYGGVSLRMTTGRSAGHALDRLKRFDTTGNVFDALDAYEKQQKDYKDALAKYAKDYKAYLAHYAKNTKGKKPAKTPAKKPAKTPPKKAGGKATGKPATTPPAGRTRRSGGSGRRGFGGRRRPGGTAAATPTKTAGAKTGTTPQNPGKTKTASSSKQGPKKPKHPRRVKKDPAKEALLAVVKGTLPLRIEVHRKDEIRAALLMAMLKELPSINLEIASDAGPIAKELRDSGATVVVTDLLQSTADVKEGRDRGALPGQLAAAGVPVAIASGSARNARNLTLKAAYACGKGLSASQAIRALTLTPAEILGVDDLVGSLSRNKIADILITSGPLLKSDTRVLRVLAQGRTQFEAKQK